MELALKKTVLFVVTAVVSCSLTALASDPDILSDFLLPPNETKVNASYFTYTGMRGILGAPFPQTFKSTQVSVLEFPALDGLGVSFSFLQFPPGSVLPPHTRPHSTGLIFLLSGHLEVGFVDTKNTLYKQSLQSGDVFIFPKGLVHYQYNANNKEPAVAIAAFGSASAGSVLVPTTVFGSGIDDVILAKSFKTDVGTVRKIKADLRGKA